LKNFCIHSSFFINEKIGVRDEFRGVLFAVAAPSPPSGHGQGYPAQCINDSHAVHCFAHILKNGVPEVLALAFAVFVNGAVGFPGPEIVVAIPEIVFSWGHPLKGPCQENKPRHYKKVYFFCQVVSLTSLILTSIF